jgi:predicted porin
MKKSLLAVSLLAAFGTASAASSVTLYGVVDASIGQTKATKTTAAGVATATTTMSLTREGRNNGLSGSRFGIKGSEELGYGLKGNFAIEEAVSTSKGELAQGITDGSSTGRQTWLGLSGGFGAISLGRQYTPFYEAIEPLTNVDVGGAFTLTSAGTIANTVRASSSVKYVSPVFSGFKVAALLASDTTKTTTSAVTTQSKPQTTSVSASFNDGKLSAALAMNNVKTKTTVSAMPNVTGTVATTGFGLGYNFGVAQAMLSFTQQKDTGSAYKGSLKTTDTTLSVKVPFGTAYVMAGVGQNKMTDGRSTLLATGNASSKGTNAVVGAGYKLSERTEVYARFAKNGVMNYKTAAGVANGSVKSDMFGLGVRHTF